MDYYDITLGLPNNFPLSDRLIAVFIFINTDLSIYMLQVKIKFRLKFFNLNLILTCNIYTARHEFCQ